jgi:hypothetical protein
MFLQSPPLWICSAWYDVFQESFDAAELSGEQITVLMLDKNIILIKLGMYIC